MDLRHYEIIRHHNDVKMGAMASQINSLTIVYSTVYSDTDQRKHQSSASLAFVRGIHRWPVNSPHKWPVARKMFPFDDVIMIKLFISYCNGSRTPKMTRSCGDKAIALPKNKSISHYYTRDIIVGKSQDVSPVSIFFATRRIIAEIALHRWLINSGELGTWCVQRGNKKCDETMCIMFTSAFPWQSCLRTVHSRGPFY